MALNLSDMSLTHNGAHSALVDYLLPFRNQLQSSLGQATEDAVDQAFVTWMKDNLAATPRELVQIRGGLLLLRDLEAAQQEANRQEQVIPIEFREETRMQGAGDTTTWGISGRLRDWMEQDLSFRSYLSDTVGKLLPHAPRLLKYQDSDEYAKGVEWDSGAEEEVEEIPCKVISFRKTKYLWDQATDNVYQIDGDNDFVGKYLVPKGKKRRVIDFTAGEFDHLE